MSSPHKKKKKKKQLLNPSTPNPSLPDDLLLSCFARVSRLYYPTLSLVSKSFGSLLSSQELYKTRSLLNRTESCLYVCLKFPHGPNPRWFTLCRRPTLKKKNPSGNLLIPVTSSHSTHVRSSFVVVGSDIHEIGGLINGLPSSNVSILDCRYNSWHEAPNMQVARKHPFAIVLDGKICVKGGIGLENLNSPKWIEVFDPKTQTWKIVSRTEEWKSPDGAGMAWDLSSCCVIDNMLYDYSNGELKWYDTKVRGWRILKGLKRLPSLNASCHVQLVNYGGKMAVLWEMHDRSSNFHETVIWCAEIALERCNSEEISGMVEWSDVVLKIPSLYSFVHVLAATV